MWQKSEKSAENNVLNITLKMGEKQVNIEF